MTGAEYLTASLLVDLWHRIDAALTHTDLRDSEHIDFNDLRYSAESIARLVDGDVDGWNGATRSNRC